MTVEYKKDDVWLAHYGHNLEEFRLLQVTGGFVRHKYGWESAEQWHARAKHRIGRARIFLGIQFGIIRD